MPGIDFHRVRKAISMADVLKLLDFQLTQRRGDQLRGPCPLHDPSGTGDRRCFSVHVDRGVFRCFGCGASGNALDLWIQWQGLPLYESALALCHALGIAPPWQAPSAPSRPSAPRPSPLPPPRPATDTPAPPRPPKWPRS